MATSVFSLGDFLSSITDVTSAAKSSEEKITAEQAAVNEQAAALEAKNKLLEQQRQGALIRQQEEGQKLAAALRLTPGEANNAIVRLTSERAALEDEQAALYQEIRQKQNVSFFDDPLAWLTSRYTINDTIDQHNAVVDRRNMITNELTTLATVADASEKANWFGVQYNDANVKAMEAQKLTVAAMKEAFERTKQLATFNIDSDMKVLHVRGALAEAQHKYLSARNEEERMDMARKQHQKQMIAFDRAARLERAAEEDEAFWGSVSKKMAKYYNGAEYPTSLLKQMYSANTPEGQAIRWIVKSVHTDSGIGQTTGEALVAAGLQQIKFGNNAEAQTVLDYGFKLADEARKVKGYTEDQWKKLGPEGQASVIDEHIEKTVRAPIKNRSYTVREDDAFYAAPTVGNLLVRSPELGNVPLWKEHLGQLPKNERLKSEIVLGSATDMLISGKYGAINAGAVERAISDVVDTYKLVNKYTATQKGLGALNIPQLVDSHRVKTSGTGMLGPNSTDTLNRSELRRYFAHALARRSEEFEHLVLRNVLTGE